MPDASPTHTSLPAALTAETLARLGSMELRARAMVEGHFSGQHRSHFKGASVEFADHRDYSQGDELRHLDWKVFGRTDRHFIKQYDAETNMNVALVVDVSGSMGYSSDTVTKLQYASYLAAGLAYLTTRQNDAPGLALVDRRVREKYLPRTRPAHLQRLWAALQAAQPGEDTALSEALAEAAATFTRRGIVVLISDLLDDPERVLRSLLYFRHRGHDVIVLQVLDPAEVKFDFHGPVVFEDLETHETLLTETDDVRAAYRRQFAIYQTQLSEGCRSAGIDYELMTTDQPFARALSAYLARRRARG